MQGTEKNTQVEFNSPKTSNKEKTPLLKIDNLCIDFATDKELRAKKTDNATNSIRAVNSINLHIFPGEFAAIVGESACGKTLTSSAIMDVLPQRAQISSGKIFFGEKNILTLSKAERRKLAGKEISMIFQDPTSSLDPLTTVGKQIEEAALVHGAPKALSQQKAREIMQKSGLAPDRIYKRYPHELSGGQKQRISISAALINSPRLLIADEPTSALDATIQNDILETILNLNKEMGTSLLLITHDFSIVRKICARVYVMYAGRIVESGDTEEVLNNPLHPYTAALLNAVPSEEKKNKRLFTINGSVPSPSERKPNQCLFCERCPVARPECSQKTPPSFVHGAREHFVECMFADKPTAQFKDLFAAENDAAATDIDNGGAL